MLYIAQLGIYIVAYLQIHHTGIFFPQGLDCKDGMIQTGTKMWEKLEKHCAYVIYFFLSLASKYNYCIRE